MPVTKHLTRLDITDFTPGLWDEVGSSTVLGPPNGFAVLTDYYPKPSGGVRAFMKGNDVLTTGLDIPSTEAIQGIHARGSVNGTAGTDHDLLLVTMQAADKKSRIYRMKTQDGETTWTKVYTDAAGATASDYEEAQFAQIKEDSDGKVHYLISVKGGSNQGIYNLTFDGVAAARFLTYTGPLVVNGARANYANGGVLFYSDIGSRLITTPGTQFLNVNPNEPGAIIGMLSQRAPSDLLVGMWGAPWYEINGDISNSATPVRALGAMHHQRTHYQTPARAPGGGIFFIEPGGRIYKTDGLNFESVSDAILRFNVDADAAATFFGPGRLGVLNDFLFAPRGYVCDLRTGAWFKSSLMADSTFHCATPQGRVYFANTGVPADIAWLGTFDGPDASLVNPVSSGVIQTLPLYDQTGRNIRIEQVEIQVQCYSSSTFVCKVIDSTGRIRSTDTVTGVTGRGQVTFRFPHVQDEYLSVYLAPSAENGTSEAPTIERMTIFFGPNNTITNAAS